MVRSKSTGTIFPLEYDDSAEPHAWVVTSDQGFWWWPGQGFAPANPSALALWTEMGWLL